MAVTLDSSIIDFGLTSLQTAASRIYLCSQVPTTYTAATSTLALGNKNFGAGLVTEAPSNAAPNGRRVLTNAVSDGVVSTSGTARGWAIVDTANTKLLVSGDIATPATVVSGQIWKLTQIEIRLPASPAEPIAIPPIGLTISVGPQTITQPAGSVTVNPGSSIQTAVNANPVNTIFWLTTGTHVQQSVVPKAGNQFVGQLGAVMDGEDTTLRAFDGTATGVILNNLEIKNYHVGFIAGTMNATGGQQAAVNCGVSWQVLQCNIHHNSSYGIGLNNSGLIRGNFIHHNGQLGIGMNDGTLDMTVDNNEISFNNYQTTFDPFWEGGGTKFWATQQLELTHNYVHDNIGPGLWTDFDNYQTLFAFNRVERNLAGIFHEISYDASIHDNICHSNGYAALFRGWLWDADILIAASGGVGTGQIDVYNNIVGPSTPGFVGNLISLIQQNRGTGARGAWLVQNVNIHNNTIDMSGGGNHGGVQDIGSTAVFTSRNNRFDLNAYKIGGTTGNFWWNNGTGGRTFWQGQGQDTNGTFT